jgi:hypothetical protein
MSKECFVCGKAVHPKTSIRVGDQERHPECKVGSKNWQATHPDHPLIKCFRPADDKMPGTKVPRHPQHKNIVAFTGRIKYLWFMHERDRKNPDYTGLAISVESPKINASAIFTWDTVLVEVNENPVEFEPRDSLADRIESTLVDTPTPTVV